MRYVSRTPVEGYQDCPRYRFNNYHLLGKGLVPKTNSVPLVTGGAVHRGIEHLANRLRIGQEPNIDTAVGLAVEQYEKDCSDAGFSGKGLSTERQQWFTFNEQRALTEALVRAWGLVEMPQLQQRFKVIAVEREVMPLQLAPNVTFMAKVDIELQENASGDYYNYSLKTAKQWGERMEESYKNDLQGITETWAVEEESRILQGIWDRLINDVERVMGSQQLPGKNLVAIEQYLKNNRRKAKILSGIRFCFLIKGQRKKPEYNNTDPNALFITYNPLIRGYKNIGPASISYAHSWFYPNPENKSGKSILGKGWEPFNVWESDISIKDWINYLASGEVQPECGDVLKQHVVTPTEYYRNPSDIDMGIAQIRYQEERINRALENLDHFERLAEPTNSDEYNNVVSSSEYMAVMDSTFPHHRKSCEFMYGEQCAYKSLCWSPEVASDPLGSRLYQVRVPHHETERNA